MTLITELEQEVQDAMRAGDAERRDALRLILSSLKSAEKELLRPLSEDEELQVLQRERKKRHEAAEAFRNAGRDEQAEKEGAELAILEEFMPEPLSEDELDRIVDDAIAENKATSMRDMGRVMADVMPQIAGREGSSAVSQLFREKLLLSNASTSASAPYPSTQTTGPPRSCFPARCSAACPRCGGRWSLSTQAVGACSSSGGSTSTVRRTTWPGCASGSTPRARTTSWSASRSAAMRRRSRGRASG